MDIDELYTKKIEKLRADISTLEERLSEQQRKYQSNLDRLSGVVDAAKAQLAGLTQEQARIKEGKDPFGEDGEDREEEAPDD